MSRYICDDEAESARRDALEAERARAFGTCRGCGMPAPDCRCDEDEDETETEDEE